MLWLAHTSVDPSRVGKRLAKGDPAQSLLFLDPDYALLREWRLAIGESARFLNSSSELASVSNELRNPFLDLLTDLGRKYDSVAWWSSRISERNPLTSPLFLHCCYLHLANRHLKGDESHLTCISSESWAVLKAVAGLADQAGVEVRWVKRAPKIRQGLEFFARVTKRIVSFLAIGLRNRLIDRAARTSQNPSPLALQRTWTDKASFEVNGEFRDRYLPGLCSWLEAQKFTVLTIPVLGKLPHARSWRSLKRAKRSFLAPGGYYRSSDYLFALRAGFAGRNMPDEEVSLAGLKVDDILDEERRRSAFDQCSLDAALSYRLPKRLAGTGMKVDLFIDLFENMIPEKPLTLGFRRYMPQTKLVGYQHGGLYPLMLCNFVTAGEAEFAPYPDRVVTVGDFARDILIQEGLPAETVLAGPALRYQHLWHLSAQKQIKDTKDRVVVVLLPLAVDARVELLFKVIDGLVEEKDLKVQVKPHPMCPVDEVVPRQYQRPLPSHFRFVTTEIEHLLETAAVAIGLGSSSIHEVIAAGTPVVIVGRETALDLNPLAWETGFGETCRGADEIRSRVLKFLSMSTDDLAQYRIKTSDLLRYSFNPVDETTMGAFTQSL